MVKPRKLTLRQAVKETKMPVMRLGDLLVYQFGGVIVGAFMPNATDWSIHDFGQPETENYIRQLYADDGWIESITHFDDEALALHHNYTLGLWVGRKFSGSGGDAQRFEVDCAQATELLGPNPSREMVLSAIRIVLMMHKKYLLSARTGARFEAGRKPNTEGPISKAMGSVIKRNPTIKNADLWNAMKSSPPRGWTFYDNDQGKYIEGPRGGQNMGYDRFRNIAAQKRKAQK
ncbi:MAG TPA: hypothetical protein VFR20_00050 [Burkholderiaceae bacterium]|nr:hypothetical protein [Burkholderiaceae bacterium]